jgi:hypothetical protein
MVSLLKGEIRLFIFLRKKTTYMRTRYIPAVFLLFFTVLSCSKKLHLDSLSFAAEAANADLAAGDTTVFSFTGNPDFITFYSGEPGHRYAYKDRISASGMPILQFTSARANGNQPHSLSLLVSEDFPGVAVGDTIATLASIAGATWTDITGRAVLSTGTAVASGNIDLSDFSKDGKPVYIAFKYIGTAGTTYSKWTITKFSVTNYLADSTSYALANMNAYNTAIPNYAGTSYSPGWVAYTVTNTYHWVVSTSSLLITGATSAAAATAGSEDWAIIGPIDLHKVTPDFGVPIKMISENMSKFPYTYQYMVPGSYTAVFLATNANPDGQDSVVRQVPITVH